MRLGGLLSSREKASPGDSVSRDRTRGYGIFDIVQLLHGSSSMNRLAPRFSVDPATHLVYFPLQNVHGRGVLRVMSPLDVSKRTPP